MQTDLLFWSGGKDSYLALELYRQNYADGDHQIKLFTTYTEGEEIVPHQQIPLKTIREQAARLDLEVITLALPAECPNQTYLDRLTEQFEEINPTVDRLVFGDWKNQEIRDWREQELGSRGYTCLFPIWQKSLHDLLPILLLKPVEVTISSVHPDYEEYLKRGESYNQALIRTLPSFIDPMGENGEFHTEVTIHDLRDQVV